MGFKRSWVQIPPARDVTDPLMNKYLTVSAIFAALIACIQPVGAEEKPSITLNPVAFEFARQLIREGRIIGDKRGAWQGDKPSRARENEFVRESGLEEYGKWHLGIDNRHSAHGKAHYKFPFGDFSALHRCGLLAVKARAHEFGYPDIEVAADQLLAQMQINRPRR